MRSVVRLLLAQLARDRFTTPLWLLGITALGVAAAAAIASEFSVEGDRAAIVRVASGSPAFLFLRGTPDGTSVGAVMFFQSYSFMAVLAALMSTFLVVRHTRTEEESGRAEMLSATSVTRTAPLIATLILGVSVNVLLFLFVCVGLILAGLPARGSVVAGLAVGAVGIVFVGVAALVAQLVATGRAANGITAGAVGIAFVVRGIGDALGEPTDDLLHVRSSWLSWLSPIGWGQRSSPFGGTDATVLLLPIAAAVLLAAIALSARQRRDLGWALVSWDHGRDGASAWGRSLPGLLFRLYRGSLAGWCVGVAVLGFLAGALGPVVADVTEGNASVTDLIGRLVPGNQSRITDVFLAALLGIAGVLAALAGVHTILRLRVEETEGRAELVLSLSVSKSRLLLTSLALAVASVVLVAGVCGVAADLARAATLRSTAELGALTAAALAHVPAALVFVALAAVVFATIPRATAALGWGLVVIGLILGQFGDLIGLPEWIQDVSPFRHSSAVPAENFEFVPAAVLTGIAIALGSVAIALYRRRNLIP
jgi:ABC-2 type transport system permease protein